MPEAVHSQEQGEVSQRPELPDDIFIFGDDKGQSREARAQQAADAVYAHADRAQVQSVVDVPDEMSAQRG